MEINCQICNRETPEEFQEKHHLKLRKKDKKKTIDVCIDCGDQIHKLFTNKELKKVYNTLEALLNNEKIQKWINWISKKKEFGVCMKTKKRK